MFPLPALPTRNGEYNVESSLMPDQVLITHRRDTRAVISPVCVPVHDTRAPARSVVHEIYGSFQGFARFSYDAITDLKSEMKGVKIKFTLPST